MYKIWFKGGPKDRWHQWAMRNEFKEAQYVRWYLLNKKKVLDACITLEELPV